MEYAKEELQSAIYRDDNTVTFIVGMCLCLIFSTAYVFCSTSMIGQGRHSEDGVSKLRPALEELFDEYVETFILRLFLSFFVLTLVAF